MKRKPLTGFLIVFLTTWIGGLAHAEVKPLALTQQDCIKCHFKVVKTMAGQESAHKTELTCLDCHEAHPPAGKAVIPKCSQCHDPSENRHFASANCTTCHNPHAPLVTAFGTAGDVKPICITCHTDIKEQMEKLPSAHSEQDCSQCHHAHGLAKGQSDTCLDCHEKHAPNLELKDCLACHQPHQPTRYIWDHPVKNAACGACHEDVVKDFTQHGALHAKKLTCTKCHEAHPPREKNVIPACSKCHSPEKKKHYTTKGCTKCHDPHKPKEIDFSHLKSVRATCLSCHADVGKTMKKHPTAHARVECNKCHPIHGKHKSCLSCHKGHSKEMKYGDCLKCHIPHYPMPPAFAKKVPSRLCGSCHGGEYKGQVADKSKHARLQCIYCHSRKHKVVPKCRTCHGQPHDAPLHRHFPDCHKCHKNPHNLAGGK